MTEEYNYGILYDYNFPVRSSRVLDSDEMYYGVELEYSLLSAAEIPRRAVCEEVIRPLIEAGKKFNIESSALWKYDTTISIYKNYRYTGELVTVPLTEEEVFVMFKDFMTSDSTKNCVMSGQNGLHIHVSRSPLTDAQIVLARTLCSDRYEKIISVLEFLGNREFNNFCVPVTNPLIIDKQISGYNRKEAISVSEDNPTVEFRFFKSTTSLFQFYVALETVQAILNYSREMLYKDDKIANAVTLLVEHCVDFNKNQADLVLQTLASVDYRHTDELRSRLIGLKNNTNAQTLEFRRMYEKLLETANINYESFLSYLKENTDLVKFKLKMYF